MQSSAVKDQGHSVVFKVMEDSVRVLSLQPPYPQNNETINWFLIEVRLSFLTTGRSIVLCK